MKNVFYARFASPGIIELPYGSRSSRAKSRGKDVSNTLRINALQDELTCVIDVPISGNYSGSTWI